MPLVLRIFFICFCVMSLSLPSFAGKKTETIWQIFVQYRMSRLHSAVKDYADFSDPHLGQYSTKLTNEIYLLSEELRKLRHAIHGLGTDSPISRYQFQRVKEQLQNVFVEYSKKNADFFEADHFYQIQKNFRKLEFFFN